MIRKRLLATCISLIALVSLFPHAALAQRGFMNIFKDNVGKLIPVFSYATSIYPSSSVKNQGTNLSVYKQDLSLFVPMWQDKQNDFSFTSSLKVRSNHGTATFPTSGVNLPGTLWDIRFGPNYRHQFGNGWILGAGVLFGSASDEPFDSYNEMELMGNLFLRVPEDNGDAWLGFINYSNNRDFLNNYPIGGFGYWFGSVEWFEGLVGIPLMSFTFLPKEKVNIHYTYYPLLNMNAEVVYKPTRWFSMMASFDWTNERYFRPSRTDRRARIFNYEKRVAAGFKVSTSRWFHIKLTGGYAFDRFYFEGRRYSDRNNDRIDIANSPFARAELTFLMFPRRAKD